MRIYERSDDIREYFKCSKVFNIEGNATHITNLAISPSEETLLCATANNQMYTFTLSNTDILKEDSMNFELLSTAFHGPGPSGSAQITAMDVCIWKPLVATCGRDRSLRIWNYQERAVELMKEFPEEPTSVALHPSGLFVVAGFPDKLRLMSLLMDDIRSIKEMPIKSCRECKFAHGGHAFAVVNNSLVQIIGDLRADRDALAPDDGLKVHWHDAVRVDHVHLSAPCRLREARLRPHVHALRHARLHGARDAAGAGRQRRVRLVGAGGRAV